MALSVGCRDSAFTRAQKADTIDAYRAFLQQRPDDPNADAARQRLTELELAEAKAVHDVVAYKRFLEAHPDTKEARTARALLEGLRFNAAKEKGTAQALRQFLREHADGAHREDAEALLATVERREVTQLDDATLASVAARHPDDEQGADARARLDERAWSKAGTAQALYAYLAAFPVGAHRDEAKRRLLALEVAGLLASGLVTEARAKVAASPLGAGLTEFAADAARVDEELALEKAKDERVRQALPSYYRRPLDELSGALEAPDALDRWQAAEELGAFASVRAIDPLLRTIRTSRSTLARRRALGSLEAVLKALPPAVAEYEVATRVEALAQTASDAQLVLTLAVLLDLSGQLERAAREYQRAHEVLVADPLVLSRWIAIRRERGQHYAMAVAARQLALWVEESARDAQEGPNAAVPRLRELCGAVELGRLAVDSIALAKSKPSEFPEDLEAFQVKAQAALKLAEARLRDVELIALAADKGLRSCWDRAVAERLEDGAQRRVAKLAELARDPKAKKDWPALRRVALKDPSPAVRAAAASVASQ